MDFSVPFQLRDKSQWMDIVFYFCVSLLVAAVFSWAIFWVKGADLKKQIVAENAKMAAVGTEEQKKYEDIVIGYQRKFNDFKDIFENHEFASNVFDFMSKNTMPNIWFKQFVLDAKGSKVQLSGEAETMEDFSRQVAAFEKNEYVKSIGVLNTSAGLMAKTNFNLDLALDPKIFNYISANAAKAPDARQAQGQQEVPGIPDTLQLPLLPEQNNNMQQ